MSHFTDNTVENYRAEVLRTCPDAVAIVDIEDAQEREARKFELLGNAALGITNESLELFLTASSFVSRDVTDTSSLLDYISEIGDLLWYCEVASFCLSSDSTQYIDLRKGVESRFQSLVNPKISHKEEGTTSLFKEGACVSPRNAKIIEDFGFSRLLYHSKNFSEFYKKIRYQGKSYDKSKAVMVLELDGVLWGATCLSVAWNVPLEVVRYFNSKKLRERYPDGFSVERSENRDGG